MSVLCAFKSDPTVLPYYPPAGKFEVSSYAGKDERERRGACHKMRVKCCGEIAKIPTIFRRLL